jgi:hypothetical protein
VRSRNLQVTANKRGAPFKDIRGWSLRFFGIDLEHRVIFPSWVDVEMEVGDFLVRARSIALPEADTIRLKGLVDRSRYTRDGLHIPTRKVVGELEDVLDMRLGNDQRVSRVCLPNVDESEYVVRLPYLCSIKLA